MAVSALEIDKHKPPIKSNTTPFALPLESAERGRLMQHRVASILLNLDIVSGVLINPQNQSQDRLGRDLTVNLAGGSPTDLVWVQVKSSQTGVFDYLKNRGAKLIKSGDKRSVRQWMKDNRQIILNGSKDDALVEADFTSQLAAIQDHQRTTSVNAGMTRFSLRY